MAETYNHDPRPRTLQECATCRHNQLACDACSAGELLSRAGRAVCAGRCRMVREKFIRVNPPRRGPAYSFTDASSPCALGNAPVWRFVHGRWGWWATCNDHQVEAS